jgi:hypothetical protein
MKIYRHREDAVVDTHDPEPAARLRSLAPGGMDVVVDDVTDVDLWLCSLEQEVLAGDHLIVVLRVHGVEPHPEVEPIVFHASGFRVLAV